MVAVLKADHDATREFVSKPIGKSADNMYSYLALVQARRCRWSTWRKRPMSNTTFRAIRIWRNCRYSRRRAV